MREATRLRMRRALWCLDADHILIAVEPSVFENPPCFEKDRAAMLVPHARRALASVTLESTAMRTATPLRT